MSRKGKMPIALPKGVQVVSVNENVTVTGPKGSLSLTMVPGVLVSVLTDHISVSTETESGENLKNFHGLYWSLINNMILGTTKGFEKKLEMIGVGYRAAVQGTMLDIQAGFSHPTKLAIPQGLKVQVEKNTVILVSGIDKQAVGQFAAEIRKIRPPEPYQGKGIRYEGEYVRRKAGKAAKTAKK
jgi:large subunit ribosomal protein L6